MTDVVTIGITVKKLWGFYGLAKGVFGIGRSAYNKKFVDELADMLNTLGNTHFEAAGRSLRDAQAESTDKGRRVHYISAMNHCEDAYTFYKQELDQRDENRKLGNKEIFAHSKAAEAALFIAERNKDLGADAAKTWAKVAKEHYDQYHAIALSCAQKDGNILLLLALFGGGALGYLFGVIGVGVAVLIGKKLDKVIANNRELLISKLTAEQEEFTQLYNVLMK